MQCALLHGAWSTARMMVFTLATLTQFGKYWKIGNAVVRIHLGGASNTKGIGVVIHYPRSNVNGGRVQNREIQAIQVGRDGSRHLISLVVSLPIVLKIKRKDIYGGVMEKAQS